MLIRRMRKNKSKGFTLVELIIVIAVIAILAVVMTTAFSGVTDNALRTRVMSQMNTFTQEVGAQVTTHFGGQCLCGGQNDVYDCPSVYNTINGGGYTGYVYKKSGSNIGKDFYVAVDGDNNVKYACWPSTYEQIESKHGIIVLDTDGQLLYAVFARGSKYYFYTLYTAEYEEAKTEYTAAEQTDWNVYVGKISDLGSDNENEITTNIEAVDGTK